MVLNALRVYFFGDSICFGQGASVHRTWIAQVAARLEQELEPKGVELLLQNYSINGNTTRMALERIAYDIQGKDVDVLVVQFGMNDANIWATDKGNPRVSPKSFEANLHEIIARVRSFGIKRIVLNTNHLSERYDVLPNSQEVYREHVRFYNTVVRRVADAYPGYVTLVDMELHIEQRLEGWDAARRREYVQPAPDLLHLSGLGNEMYYEYFYPRLLQIVEQVLESQA